MSLFPYFLDILKYLIAGCGVVFVAFYLLRPYLDRDEKIQLLEFKKTLSNQTLPLRLQAYERLVLFIERINPGNMLIRLNAPSYAAHDLYRLLVEEIRNEYQHNVTQQIYVSSRAWGVVQQLKEDTLTLINKAAKGMPEDATGLELSKVILASLNELDENPYELGPGLLRKDLEEIF
ncbi:MAG TPA: hypothetical protein VHA56_10700 [Mucilaginibacter sp.]|nr:hypothetical protein [Mucilaginibacter sp.]